jgi:arginase
MRIDLITVPYRYDERETGLGAGPSALFDAGIVERLTALGYRVEGPSAAFLAESDRDEHNVAINIGRLGASTANLVATARESGAGALVLAGDDTASIGVVSGLQQADVAGAAIGIVWLDAHGDFNTPETSFSGILAGMPVAILAGLAGPLWRRAAGLAAPIPTDRILIAGVRELDRQEETLLRSTDVAVITAEQLTGGDAFERVIERLALRCDVVFLLIDLDVLDPHLVPSSTTPSAGGLSIEDAAKAIATVLETQKVAAVCVTSLNPGGGQRGERSVETAASLIEQALKNWTWPPVG